MRNLARLTIVALVSCALLLAQDAPGGRIEFTGSYWFPDIRGAVRSGEDAVDLRGDLGIEQQRLTSFGTLVLKPGRNHRIVVEGTPYRLRGRTDLGRRFTFNDREFIASDTVRSSIDLLYLFGGYRYDIVNRASGHLGLVGGVSYLHAEGSLQGVVGAAVRESRSVPLPLAGVVFERNVTGGGHPISISGDAKGMVAGDYGRFGIGSLQVGVRILPNLTIRAGYAVTHLDIHVKDQTVLFRSTFAGPVVSVNVRDRR
jgi:hypothetical protein